MKINNINTYFSNNNLQFEHNKQQVSSSQSNVSSDLKFMPHYVAFTGKKDTKVTLADYLAHGMERESEKQRLIRIRDKFYNDLTNLAQELKDDGITFNMEYNKPGSIKSVSSSVSKIKRSCNFNIPDKVRATLFAPNIYDLKLLTDKIIPMLAKPEYGGYILATNSEGAPDLSIRLNQKKDEYDFGIDKDLLSDEMLDFYDGPQKSGYEDVQLRLIRKTDSRQNPFKLELIILFGPDYAKAKHMESDLVYSNLRKLDELNMKFTDTRIGSSQQKAKRNIDLIKQKIGQKISEVLFRNAKNKDIFNLDINEPIEFTETDILLIKSYFTGLNDRLCDCYYEKFKKTKSEKTKDRLTDEMLEDKYTISLIKANLKKIIADLSSNRNTTAQSEDGEL